MWKQRSTMGLLLASLTFFVSSPMAVADGVGIGVRAGFIGVGVDVTARLADKLNARIGFTTAPYDDTQTEDGIEYEVDIAFRQLQFLLDYHPFGGNLRLSGGMVRNNSKLLFEAAGQTEGDIGNTTYVGTFSLDGALSFQPLAPYVGIGYGNAVRPGKGLGFFAEIGVIASGTIDFELNASGIARPQGAPQAAQFDVRTNAQFQEDLKREQQNVQDELDELELLPVLMLGLTYQF